MLVPSNPKTLEWVTGYNMPIREVCNDRNPVGDLFLWLLWKRNTFRSSVLPQVSRQGSERRFKLRRIRAGGKRCAWLNSRCHDIV